MTSNDPSAKLPTSAELLDSAKRIHPRLVDLRRRIHEEPELGLHILNESKRDIQKELFR